MCIYQINFVLQDQVQASSGGISKLQLSPNLMSSTIVLLEPLLQLIAMPVWGISYNLMAAEGNAFDWFTDGSAVENRWWYITATFRSDFERQWWGKILLLGRALASISHHPHSVERGVPQGYGFIDSDEWLLGWSGAKKERAWLLPLPILLPFLSVHKCWSQEKSLLKSLHTYLSQSLLFRESNLPQNPWPSCGHLQIQLPIQCFTTHKQRLKTKTKKKREKKKKRKNQRNKNSFLHFFFFK